MLTDDSPFGDFLVDRWLGLADGIAWRRAAVSDGWESKEITNYEKPQDRYYRLTKRGFRATLQYFNSSGDCLIVLYGPDNIGVEVPRVYNWQKIKRNLRRCVMCKRRGDVIEMPTTSAYPSSRICSECVAKLQKSRLELLSEWGLLD